ncbi:MAG TPA: DUF6636 domain-containing protein [Gaiellaceae bacterium]|jgi:hypothetical protein|nr:DUF6636 domain-containing protein [Gaiellaceae bacterium]
MRVLLGLVVVLALFPSAAEAKTIPGFRSPSKNITCLLVSDKPELVNCEIAQADYKAKLTHYCGSAPFGVDWGGFSLGRSGKGGVVCTGGTLYDPGTEHPHYVVLAYGTKWKQGTLSCDSETIGVTCTNGHGHGIFVSRASYKLW